jgi:CheY-like chemotaxis protein
VAPTNASVHCRHDVLDRPMENSAQPERRAMKLRPDNAEANPVLGADDLGFGVTRTGPGLIEMRAGAAPRRMIIVLVEDDAPTTHALVRVLGKMGQEVVTAADGVETWSLLQCRPVQVVLSDWTMSWMDGLELCRRIRSVAGPRYTYTEEPPQLLRGNGAPLCSGRPPAVAAVAGAA